MSQVDPARPPVAVTAAATYEVTLRALAEADPRIVVLTAENRAAIRNLPPLLGDRFIDFGICEQTMVGAAAGLALRGRVPVVHALATFLTLRAYEFIRTDVGIAGLPVKLIGAVPGFLSDANGPTHQAIEDLAVMRAIPGMQVFCPADERELCEGLPAVLASPSPCYVRLNTRAPSPAMLANAGARWAPARPPFELGRAEVLTDGDDLAVLGAGFLIPNILEACTALRAAAGVAARAVNLRTMAPLDEAAIVTAARGCGLLVTVEDHLLVGGIYQAVCEVLVRHRVFVPVVPIGLDARWFTPGRLPEVLDHEGFTPVRLADRFHQAWTAAKAGALGPASSGTALAGGHRAGTKGMGHA
jgi:transketolase